MKRFTIGSVLTLVSITLVNNLPLSAQTSTLVYPGPDGKLYYEKFANTGQEKVVHQIPDFSHAGYRGGGVALPIVPVVKTVAPAAGDMRAQLQDAIDKVANMPPDGTGFRGAILLKSGRYEIDGTIYIRNNGIVLRGEGQWPADEGGTELVATAHYQHSLIQFEGNELIRSGGENKQLDTQPYPGLYQWITFDASAGVRAEKANDNIITFQLTNDINAITYLASKEDAVQEHHPRLVVTVTGSAGHDSLIILYPTDDTYIKGEADAATVFGHENKLALKYAPTNPRVHREAFLKFDLSALPDSIKEARLNLYTVIKDKANGAPYTVSLFYLKYDDWTEDILAWDTYFSNNLGPAYVPQRLTADVPGGASSVQVENGAVFSVGDTVHITRTPNETWINTLDMAQYGWEAGSYRVNYERIIVAIKGNTITVNAPLVQAIEEIFGGGEIKKVSIRGRIQNCGIENMVTSSIFENDQDEDHGWNAIEFIHSDNCWVRNITARYFGYSCVNLNWAYHTTIEECAMLDPKSITTGGRKYSFVLTKGSFNLFQRCYTRGGRHDYVTHSRVAGPNVFVDCVATETHADIGPHHRYATGILFDNIKGGQIRVQNRRDMGTGHGWAGAQTMFWNCFSVKEDIKVESPIGAMNWGIGCIGNQQNGAGFWESWGTHVTPRSLYYKQLEDRLGEEAVMNVTIPEQRSGKPTWALLENWAGVGNLTPFPTSVAGIETIPKDFGLFQNYPNPFNPETTIAFSLAKSGNVRLAIYDVLGQNIRTLVNQRLAAGRHKVVWDGRNAQGHPVPAGIYFYRLHTDNKQKVKKMVVVR